MYVSKRRHIDIGKHKYVQINLRFWDQIYYSDGKMETFTLNSLVKSGFVGVLAFHLTECNTKTEILG